MSLVDDEVIESFKEIYKLKLKKYDHKDIFNCDETVFYKCVPSKTYCQW